MQIPIADQAKPINQNVQVNQVNPQSYGAVGQTLANLGGQIEGFAHRLMDKRNKADAADFAASSSQDFDKQMTQFYQQTSNQMAEDGKVYQGKDEAGNDKFYTKTSDAQKAKVQGVDFNEFVGNYAKKISDQKMDYAPNELGKEAWQEMSNAHIFHWQQRSMNDQNNYQQNASEQQDFLRTNQEGANAYNVPNAKTAADRMAQFSADIKNKVLSGRYSQLKGDLVIQKYNNVQAQSTADGLLTQASVSKDPDLKHSMLQQYISNITGKAKDPDGSWKMVNDNLLPHVKGAFVDKARKEVEVAGLQKASSVHERLNGMMAGMMVNPNAATPAEIASLHADINKLPGTSKDHDLLHAQLESTHAAALQIADDKLKSPAEWKPVSEVTAAFDKTGVRSGINAHALHIQAMVSEQRKQLLEEGTTSPAAYWVKHDPTVRMQEQAAISLAPGSYKALASTLEAKQKSAGQRREYAPPDLRKNYAQLLNDPSETKQAQNLTRIQQETGPDFDHIMAEMRKDKSVHVPEAMVVAGNTPIGPNVIKERADILKVMTPANQKAIHEAYTQIEDVRGLKGKEQYGPEAIETLVNKKLTDLQHATVGVDATNAPAFAGMRDAVKFTVMKNLAQKGSISDMDKEIDAASKSLIESKFTTVKENNSAMGIVVPKYSSGQEQNPDTVKRFVKTARDPAFLKENLDIGIPDKFAQIGKQQGFSDKEIVDSWHARVAKEGQWATHSSMAAAQLFMPDEDNKAYIPVGNSKGQTVVMQFSEMQKMANATKLKSLTPIADTISNVAGKGIELLHAGLKEKQIMENKMIERIRANNEKAAKESGQ